MFPLTPHFNFNTPSIHTPSPISRQDYICNWLGNQAWAQAMNWTHQADFVKAPANNWTVAGTAAGTLQTSNGFSFLRVFDAGHMVPRDQPEHALAMLNAFISGKI